MGRRLRMEARQEAERLGTDPAYAAEMQAIRAHIEAVHGDVHLATTEVASSYLSR